MRKSLGLFHHASLGLAFRVLVLGGVTSVCGMGVWMIGGRVQEDRPFAQRWNFFTRPVPIQLVEVRETEDPKIKVYCFSFPNSFDYPGYEPISSVLLSTGEYNGRMNCSRWYTPISPPNQRGTIEFAVKNYWPGRMANRWMSIKTGDYLYMSRWMKEFSYVPNKYPHIGMVSSGGCSSVLLQLLRAMNAQVNNKNECSDLTKLSVMHCYAFKKDIAFRGELDAYVAKNPERFKIVYDVMQGAPAEDPRFVHGLLDVDTLKRVMPSPVVVSRSAIPSSLPSPSITLLDQGNNSTPTNQHVPTQDAKSNPTDPSEAQAFQTNKSQILVCGRDDLCRLLCGPMTWMPVVLRPFFGYFGQGWVMYTGMLYEMGYQHSQVYKFGTHKRYFSTTS